MEGDLAQLRALVESSKTSARLTALFAKLKADGVIDLTEGEWTPDDGRETFVKREAAAQPPA